MQSSDETSCSDCKLELIQNTWISMLLNWLNRCVHPDKEVKVLTPSCLADIMNKYKKDVCENDIDRAILCTDDIEPFIQYKYPILRLRFLDEASDYRKKQYIMTTVLLFHCCIKSKTGLVHTDICTKLSKYEQEVILKFCERLDDMEITINNVDCAIKEAFDYVKYVRNIPNFKDPSSSDVVQPSAEESDNLPSFGKLVQESLKSPKLSQPSKFNSSVTVLPTVVTDTSTVSDLTESETSGGNKYAFSDSDEVNVYPLEHRKRRAKVEIEIKRPKGSGPCCRPRHLEQRYGNDELRRRENIYHSSDIEASSEEMYKEPKNKRPRKESGKDSPEKKFAESKHAVSESKKKVRKSDKDEDQTSEKSEDVKTDEEDDKKSPVKDEEKKSTAKSEEKKSIVKSEGKKSVSKSERPSIKGARASIKDEPKVDKDGDNAEGKDLTPAQEPHLGIVRHSEKNAVYDSTKDEPNKLSEQSSDHHCLENCSCSKCITAGNWCGDLKSPQKKICDDEMKKEGKGKKCSEKWGNLSTRKKGIIIGAIVGLLGVIALACVLPIILLKGSDDNRPVHISNPNNTNTNNTEIDDDLERFARYRIYLEKQTWMCKNNLCQRVFTFEIGNIFSSLSRCSLICMGPQLWPFPIGYTFFSKKIVALSTTKLEYKFQSLPSEAVHQYLAEAFKLFIGDLARLERTDDENLNTNSSDELTVKKMNIQIDVESDPEPRMRINTEESYQLKIDTINNQVIIKLSSASFCGVRHGLQTLSQIILLDQSTGKLITLSNVVIKDAPTYRYRGLMIDTARNFIPISDLMRNIDAMATVKLNTFHWRISDVTSFPLYLPKQPELFEYGAYDRSMVYTKEDVRYLVNRAAMRGIRVIIEVAAPGPVGRAWSWHPEVSCPTKTANFTCKNVLCLRLQLHDSILDILQTIYAEILEMTSTDDIFHLSDGVFSMTNCHYLIEERQGFLDKALERLKRANKGFLPKLPIIWHTPHLTKDFEAKTWEQYGVQLAEMPHDPADVLLAKFRVIHSSKWDLSCEMKKNRCTKYRTWQEMYGWKSWRNIEAFTLEGGEAILWTDMVNSGNLDTHIWPRAAAVAERLWSDTVANTSAGTLVYIRLDSQRWRMLLNGVKVMPIWPLWCSLNPSKCLEKIR